MAENLADAIVQSAALLWNEERERKTIVISLSGHEEFRIRDHLSCSTLPVGGEHPNPPRIYTKSGIEDYSKGYETYLC